MKITSDNLKAVTFAIGKRLQGYRLLKNPKGTPAAQVNMIKGEHKLNKFFDDEFVYKRISKNFDNGNSKLIEKVMNVVHYMNDITGKISDKKRIYYKVKGSNVADFKFKKREDLKPAELKFRKPIKFPSRNPLVQLGDYDRFLFERRQANKDRNYYRTTDDVLTKICTAGILGDLSKPKRPNFFKVLFNNLNN